MSEPRKQLPRESSIDLNQVGRTLVNLAEMERYIQSTRASMVALVREIVRREANVKIPVENKVVSIYWDMNARIGEDQIGVRID